jgi:hypothetical protein
LESGRLVLREGKVYLKVSLFKDYIELEIKDGVAVGIKMSEIVVGKNDTQYVMYLVRKYFCY